MWNKWKFRMTILKIQKLKKEADLISVNSKARRLKWRIKNKGLSNLSWKRMQKKR